MFRQFFKSITLFLMLALALVACAQSEATVTTEATAESSAVDEDLDGEISPPEEEESFDSFGSEVVEQAEWAVSLDGPQVFDVYITGNEESEMIRVQYANLGSQIWLPDDVSLNYRYEIGDDGDNWLAQCIGEEGCFTVSAFRCSDWVHEHRPTYISSSTESKQTGEFAFRFCNEQNKPPREEPYIEHYDIAHGSEWFYAEGWEERIMVRIHVQP